jgi:hypothetical protein
MSKQRFDFALRQRKANNDGNFVKTMPEQNEANFYPHKIYSLLLILMLQFI